MKKWAKEDAEEYEDDCVKMKDRGRDAAADKKYYESIKNDKEKYKVYKARKATERRQ